MPTSISEIAVQNTVLYLKEAPTWINYVPINVIVLRWVLGILNVEIGQWILKYVWHCENIDALLLSNLGNKLLSFHDF